MDFRERAYREAGEGMPEVAGGAEIVVVEDRAEKEHAMKMLENLAEVLLAKRDEAVMHRASSGVERRWREDEIAFDGMDGPTPSPDMIDYATGDAYRTKKKDTQSRSKVVVNIVRARCETAEGRFADILLPTDDKNWGLKTTPVPDISEQLRDDRPATQGGKQIVDAQEKPMKMSDIAKDKVNRAKKAMKLMEMEIDDQLNESDFNGECRKAIRQAVRLGTGVMKGPNVIKSVSHAYFPQKNEQDGSIVHILETKEDFKPGSSWCDIWNIFPSAGTTENVQKSAEYIWERDEILGRDVKKLLGVEGYMDDMLKMVLEEAPIRYRVSFDEKKKKYVHQRSQLTGGNAYEMWTYYGDVDRKELEVMDCDCDCAEGNMLSACVIFINGRPVKAELNELETGELPFDFFQWTTVNSNDPWGIGVPRMMVWLQRILTGAWRAMMDNAGDSAGAMVAIRQGLSPADGVWEIGKKKLWIANDDIEDIRHAFSQFQLQSNQGDLQNIIELCLKFVDLETSLPTIFQGEATKIPETLGATNIMVNSSNVGLRQRVKIWDDRVTRQHIRRYYHYNMQYNGKAEIKGDFKVDARGVSALLERDQEIQTLIQIFKMKSDPDVNVVVDWEKATRQILKRQRLDIVKSDTDIEAAKQAMAKKPPPEDPRVKAAKIRGETVVQTQELRNQADHQEYAFDSEQANLNRQHELQIKQMEYNMKLMEYAEKRGMKIEELKVQLALGGAGMNLQRELAEGKDKPTAPKVPQVVTPPTEPPGQAPDGEAYQR